MSKEIEAVKDQQIQVIDLSQAKEAMRLFEKFKADVLVKSDFYVMRNDSEKKPHVKKTGWMKYAMTLGISTHVYNERSETIKFKDKDILVYHWEAKAVAPNGRFMEASGSASSDEERSWADSVHGIRAMAQTRAVNRAVSNLVGGGEVSAEELDSKSIDAEYRVKQTPQSSSQIIHDANDEDHAISVEQDIQDALTGAGLDPQGIEIIRGREWNSFILKPMWPKPAKPEDNPWRKYNDVLVKTFGAKYRGKDDKDSTDETRYNWTIGM